ncbi:unnamed protein product [Cylicostephanus goldi]|uniref:C-type lectin domain-containing protein n=1 Tax=Cylicostephanus goldi TaxID=71465 RepID=A0A3P6RM32_CYLGO|nr:unnamed protein product [Cylicostephanus goldi]
MLVKCGILQSFFTASFDNAESSCKMKGGHLVSIHSHEENLFVAALAKTGKPWSKLTDYSWIGLKQADYPKNKEWTWTDGTKVDFLTFASNQPDNYQGREHCTEVWFEQNFLRHQIAFHYQR